MPNPIYRFDNTPWGGAHNVVLELQEMPEWFPVGQEKDQDVLRAKSGHLWSYTWYQKEASVINFRGVGTAILATMGSIARQSIAFRWFKDVTTPDSGTGTFMQVGPFEYTHLTPLLCDFYFTVEEI